MVEVVDYQERFHYWAGEYFERIGDLSRAVEYYRRGIRRDPQELSLNLGGLARVFEALGQPDSATAAARAHDSVMSNQLDYPLLPPMLARGGRIAEAIATATAWVRTLTERGNLQGAVRGTIALAEVLQSAGRWPEMRTRAEVAESLARRVSLTEEWMQAERLRGLALTRMGQVDSGLRVLRNAAARADAHPTADGILLTQVALGDALAAAGRVEAALAAFGRAASRVEETMGHLAQDLDRARYRDRQLSPFDGAVRVLLRDSRRSRLQRLAAWSGRRKAASLALATGLTPRPVTHPADAKRPSHWQARLGPGDALVDYLVLDSLVAALVLTSTRAEVVALPIRADTARAMVERLRRPLSMAYAGRVDLARAAYDLALARVLYQRLVEPLNHLVAGTRRWFIVPDGPLHRIPFDALVAGGPADGSGTFSYADAAYLVDQVEIVTLPSADFLPDGPRAHEPGPGARGVLAVGHRAPAVDEELRGIVAAWPAGRVHALSGDSATETAVRALAGDHDVWHFATHARADDREPEASHLRLLADEQHDGYLHLVEISANLKPRGVVVLSACETLAGRLFQGEGLLGLSRAFLAAGAKAVIATQWPVGPASADLMTRFHAALARSAPTAEALRAAKLALRRDPTTAHPFYWAGFVLVAGPGGTADPRPQAAASSAGAPGDTLPELPRLQSARRTTSPQRFPSLDPALSRVRALRD
jgi:CHAT domain-containing protein